MLRTVVVDDDQSVRRLLTVVLPLDPRVKVVGEAEDSSMAVTLVEELRPDVIILDHRMPGRTGAAVVPTLKKIAPDVDIIFFSAYVDSPDHNYELFQVSHAYGCYLLSKGDTSSLELLLKKLEHSRALDKRVS